ncbi:MAG: DUF47 family protein, partial [Atopostipes suicloacalis]|nr:DUF47 family protein [Atopostipes suicloacalis]
DRLLSLEKELAEVKKIESMARKKREELTEQLYKDFLPPIEREDIIEISRALTNISKRMGDILFRLDSYQVKSLPREFISFLFLVEEASEQNLMMIKELAHFKKAQKIKYSMKEIKALIAKGDMLYYSGIKQVFLKEEDSSTRSKYLKIYDDFHEMMHSFEEVTNAVETMIIKNN